MKKLIAALMLLFSLSAMADPVVAESVDAAKAVVVEKCKEGCLILAPADIAVLSAQIDAALELAYRRGLAGWSKEAALETK